ncbi:MAG: tetratricopeptide repeat protein [Afipia sp.]|nr:tetratricopeptide repeat protein [Afipia sp.]
MSCTAARSGKVDRAFGARAAAIALSLFTALLLICSPATAQAIKGEATLTAPGKFARLVLKFEQDVPTEAVVAGGILVIRFKSPVDVSVDKLSEALPDYVGSVRRDPDGMAIRMALVRKVNVNLMTAGERIFLDLLPEGWAGLPPGLPPEVVKELSDRAIAAERALRAQKIADEAQKRPPVRVRASVQPTFVRYIFETPDGVTVSSSLNSDSFILSFNSALTFDLADAKIAMPSNIKSIEQKIEGEASKINIALIGEVDVHAFREDRNYVVDIGFQQSEKPAAQMNIPQIVKSQAAASMEPQTAPSPPPTAKVAEIVPPTSADIAREAKADPATKPATETEQRVQEPAQMPPPPEKKTEMPSAVTVSPSPAVSADAPSPNAAVAVETKRTSDDFRLTFPFRTPVPAAAFRRADSIWVVFDTAETFDTGAIMRDGSSIVSDVTQFNLSKGRAIRIRLARPQLAAFSAGERGWVLTIADKVLSPSQPLVVTRNVADPARANVSIAVANPGQIHRLEDPDAGISLLVVTAPGPASGLMKRQSFVEFSLLETIHGIVVQPNADDLSIELSTDKAMLGRPGGLTLSAAMMAPERATSIAKPVFDINEWREDQKADFIERRDRLMTAAAQSSGEQRMPAHLDLARFYMARGFYPEAKGILDLALSEVKQGSEDPSALIVHAVASTLLGHPEQSLKDLASPVVGTNFDSQLWKALAFARMGRWADAREKFKNVEFALTSQPIDLQRIAILDAFRASLEVKDYAGATSRSNDLDVVGIAPEQTADAAVLRGRLAEALGREKDALLEYQTAADSADRPAAAEGKILSVSLRQKRNEIGDDDALRDLETVSIVWRGDDIEIKNLQLLSRAYASKGKYADALAASRTATKLQPNSEISRKLQDEASALFEQIFNGTKGDDLPPVEALGLFYDYRELTPIGRRGDEMIRRLADRLVAVDLLDQASELLQYQVDKRLEGAARAQVATRLAMIYLMNRKPDRAIAALRSTRIADLAGEVRQQRLLLEARAQSDIGRYDLALDIVSNVTGREAIRLRSDIYWAARRWRESAEQIELLYGNRWKDFQPLTPPEKSDIVRAVIGYSLAEDAIGLARFREKYAPKMDGEEDRAPFDLASKPASANSADFVRIAKIAASIDTLDGFLREMKTRFPDAVARAKLPPEIKADPNPTGSLPEIVGLKTAPKAARR